jgi:hypothetical protein
VKGCCEQPLLAALPWVMQCRLAAYVSEAWGTWLRRVLLLWSPEPAEGTAKHTKTAKCKLLQRTGHTLLSPAAFTWRTAHQLWLPPVGIRVYFAKHAASAAALQLLPVTF